MPEEGGTPPAPAGTLDAATVQTMITNAVKEATKGLQSEVMSLQSAAVTASRREELVKVLGDSVPESFKATVLEGFEGRTFADEKAFSEFLDKTKANVATFTQELADKGLSLHEKPVFGSPNKDGVSAGVESYIQAKAAEARCETAGPAAFLRADPRCAQGAERSFPLFPHPHVKNFSCGYVEKQESTTDYTESMYIAFNVRFP